MDLRFLFVTVVLLLSVCCCFSQAFVFVENGDFVITPVGYVHRDCLHEVPNNANIDEIDGEVWITADEQTYKLDRKAKCESPRKGKLSSSPLLNRFESRILDSKTNAFPANYDGWLAYTTAYNKNGFDSFLGYFSVPQMPKNDPQALYLFTGLQNVDWIPKVDPEPKTFDIIQPVLQYPGDKGNYWSVKSWYVTLTSDVLVSPEAPCTVGTSLFGNMTMTGPQSWYIGSTNQDGKTVSLNVNRPVLASQPWAYVTLECYGCSSCSYEPVNSSNFTELSLTTNGKPVIPNWNASISPKPVCHEAAHITNPSTISITFQ